MTTPRVQKDFTKLQNELRGFRERGGIREQVQRQFFNAYWYARLHPMSSTANKALAQHCSPYALQGIFSTLRDNSALKEFDASFDEGKKSISLCVRLFLIYIPNFLYVALIFASKECFDYLVSCGETLFHGNILIYREALLYETILLFIAIVVIWSSISLLKGIGKFLSEENFILNTRNFNKNIIPNKFRFHTILTNGVSNTGDILLWIELEKVTRTKSEPEKYKISDILKLDTLIVKKLFSYFLNVLLPFLVKSSVEQFRQLLQFLITFYFGTCREPAHALYERGVGCTSVGGIPASSEQHALSLLSVHLGITRENAVSRPCPLLTS